MIRVRLDGEIPAKKNQKILTVVGGVRSPRRAIALPSKNYQQWHKGAKLQVRSQILPGPAFPLQSCALVSVQLYYGTRRAKDCSNTLESVMDLLVDCGILADDNFMVTGPVMMYPIFRQGQGGAEVHLFPASDPLGLQLIEAMRIVGLHSRAPELRPQPKQERFI